MKTYIFLDLDDTLFQSRAKCAGAEQEAVAFLRDGSAHSFMTGRQLALWRLLDSQASVIPTTARDFESYRRVRLPFRHACILDHGGLIIQADGQPDPEWLERMQAATRDSLEELNQGLALLEDFIAARQLAVHVRLIEDFGLPFYLVAKYREHRAADLDLLQREAVEPWLAAQAGACYLHRNGNNLAVLPRTLGKEQAVRYLSERLREEHGEILTIGMGDSLSDLGFMTECDYLLLPRGSQLGGAAGSLFGGMAH